VGPGHVLDHVLEQHQLVGHGGQGVEADVDLGLAGGADLVVLDLDGDVEGLQRHGHLRAQVLEVVHRRDREVALLVAGLVAEVGALVPAGVPGRLDRVDRVHGRVLGLAEADVVEHEELGLGPDVTGVGHAGRQQVLLGLLGDEAGVPAVVLAGDGVVDEAVQVQRAPGRERVEVGRVGVGPQDHVRLLDLLEPPDRGAVEAVALLEALLGELVQRHREVLHQPRQVTEPEVDDLHAFLPGVVHDLGRRALFHGREP
jgi:hypothetical protein